MTVLFEYVVFYVLYVFVGWPVLLANTLSFVAGLGVSFFFNQTWAFHEDEYRQPVHRQMVMNVFVAVTNLVLNNLIVADLQHLSVDPRLGKIVAVVVIAGRNFVIYRQLVFVRKM